MKIATGTANKKDRDRSVGSRDLKLVPKAQPTKRPGVLRIGISEDIFETAGRKRKEAGTRRRRERLENLPSLPSENAINEHLRGIAIFAATGLVLGLLIGRFFNSRNND